MVLELLLCQLEEPANIATKLKEVEQLLMNKVKTEEGKAQALKLQAKLNGEQELVFSIGICNFVTSSGDKIWNNTMMTIRFSVYLKKFLYFFFFACISSNAVLCFVMT